MFEPLPAKFSFPESEQRVLEFWKKHDVFARSLDLRRDGPRFVFYEGPPTANGMPHPGHCLTRAIKDLFPRYKTMRGHLVERKAGWDTHGLPVEVEVCKELGIHSKEEIEEFGVEEFVKRCTESVFRYTREWEEMTDRLGFWINLDEAYVTFHQSYVESVWWGLKTLFERDLLYQGHKVVWWWAQGGTALSAGEVGEGYRTVEDPSVYIRFPLVRDAERASRANEEPRASARPVQGNESAAAPGEPRGLKSAAPHEQLDPSKPVSLLVWTTTPWTLVSNHFAAVHPLLDYALVHDKTGDEYFYIATDLVEPIAEKVKHEFEVVSTCRGEDLLGVRYVPPFDVYYGYRRSRSRVYVLPTPNLEPLYLALGFDPDARACDAKAPLKSSGRDYIGWRVVPAEFVTLDTGTGIVHQAPAYGEVDFELLQEERERFIEDHALPLLNAVNPDGTFDASAPAQYRGRWVKDCDKEIMRELRDRGIMFHQESVKHEYPFCPRSEDDPLIQYARKSWFVRTSKFKEEFLKNNDGIYWLPEHIKEGRFGDFLRNNVDWALSRERYWGTPLPIWGCEKTGKMEAIGSYKELLAKPGIQGTAVWEEAKKADPDLPEHLKVHKPYIDAITYDSPFDTGEEPRASARADLGSETVTADEEPRGLKSAAHRPRMRRVPEVIDCWWDAGSMPFAQWGFPHVEGSVETFAQRFPCDFISEAIDQTRGWFYGLLAISTLLFSTKAEQDGSQSRSWSTDITHSPTKSRYPMPYKTCIVLGHVMGEDGLKMSKRTKNFKEPDYIFDHLGADAMRWYFFSAQTPWTSVRFQENAIRDSQREFLVRLYNVFSFFNIYANIDGFDPGTEGPVSTQSVGPVSNRSTATGYKPVPQRSQIDRWITSELHRTIKFVREALDRFENYPAAGRLNEFVDALSNWYVRRSRDRFWRPLEGSVGVPPASDTGYKPVPQDQDKWDAYNTLHEVLMTLSKLIAPFTPFFAETMYQNLVRGQGVEGARGQGEGEDSLCPISVHLCDYPESDEALIDETLAREMDLVRQVVSTGRAARTSAKLKVRQPLARVEIILAWKEYESRLQAHTGLIAEELNVKNVEFTHEADHYVHYQIKPNFKVLGPKFGKLAPKVGSALNKLDDPAAARKTLLADGELALTVGDQTVTLTKDDVDIRLEAKEGWSASQGRVGVVVVSTELTPKLREEGLMRELIHHVQGLRKQRDLAYEARVTLYVTGPGDFLDIVRRFTDTITSECLAERIEFAAPPGGDVLAVKIERHEVKLTIQPV